MPPIANSPALARPSSLIVQACTVDVGAGGATPADYAEACVARVLQAWDSGADVALLPEYTWAGLEPLLPAGSGLAEVAHCFWAELLPSLTPRLARVGKAAVLGTAPWLEPSTGKLYNRAPIVIGGRWQHQDKLFLTPWESAFTPGDALHLLEIQGLRAAVVICLDIEMPGLSSLLREQALDLLLVPSATETVLGCERVTRCASARAIELGCAVVVSPLVGRCTADLIDISLGRLGFYLPSQAALLDHPRHTESALHEHGWHSLRAEIPAQALAAARANLSETNPSLVNEKARLGGISLVGG